MDEEQKLIESLKSLCAMGPVAAFGSGSNSVGKTMQNYLGIRHKVVERNKLFGYTITSTLGKSNSGGRTNLFACVPDWNLSRYKSSNEFVMKFGREDVGRGYQKSLFCTVNSLNRNSFGLQLKVDIGNRSLEEWAYSGNEGSLAVKWSLEKIQRRLSKLGKTAILRAVPVDLNGTKAFHYRYLDLLGAPQISSFLDLIDSGGVTIDHCISMKFGSSSARERGPLFKIRADSLGEMYTGIRRFDLMDI
jgi:hypothetical protein